MTRLRLADCRLVDGDDGRARNSHAQAAFANQYESDLARRFRLIGIDLPGHGDSGWATHAASYSLRALGRTLSAFIRGLALDEVVIVGHSLGGHIALEAHAIEPLARGIVISGAAPISRLEDMPHAFHPHPDLAYFYRAELSDNEVQLMASCCYRGPHPAVQDSVRMIRRADPTFRPSLGASVQNLEFIDERAVATALGPRLAILHGEHDPLVKRDYLTALDTSSVTLIKGSGHSPHAEFPAQFNAELASFCRRCFD